MSQFARKLNNLEQLTKHPKESLPKWWSDMLILWRPSGVAADEFGLRLAIRNGYLNFYRRGQSIARVTINGEGIPTAETHFKYVCGDGDKPAGQEYVKLDANTILRGGKSWRDYGGIQDLKNWITLIDDKYAGDEKKFVDQLVAANPDVIDLEMGLPAWGTQKSAPRMDLVALEGGRVVFWEAKLAADGRLRSSTEVVKNEIPKVLKQLNDYRKFLSEAEHVALVDRAYRCAASELLVLRHEADKLGQHYTLGDAILDAASPSAAPLKVDSEPRLVVQSINKDPKYAKQASLDAWEHHAGRLRNEGVFMTVIEHGGPFLLDTLK